MRSATTTAVSRWGTTPRAGSGYSYEKVFTSYESFMLTGEFTYSGSGSFGLAFDFNGKEEKYKLISVDPAENKLSLYFEAGEVPVTETQAALVVRMYGVTGKPIYLFAENNSVELKSLKQYTQ